MPSGDHPAHQTPIKRSVIMPELQHGAFFVRVREAGRVWSGLVATNAPKQERRLPQRLYVRRSGSGLVTNVGLSRNSSKPPCIG